ncbi:hypothetical protein HNY73_015960 [Argiope bruennichi]|uniref:Uncharacterized protein n=1 Tax=Argiope bruennichi TaxID=94029 RepID=A0A8T0EI85_ARGBR|nr:hypothetical protein HNY73_015960 [Argiope bruennichi]
MKTASLSQGTNNLNLLSIFLEARRTSAIPLRLPCERPPWRTTQRKKPVMDMAMSREATDSLMRKEHREVHYVADEKVSELKSRPTNQEPPTNSPPV